MMAPVPQGRDNCLLALLHCTAVLDDLLFLVTMDDSMVRVQVREMVEMSTN